MPPKATISHQTSRRLRLRIPAKRRDAAYFAALQEELAHCPGVLKIEANPLTGSVLVHHRSAVQALIDYAEETQLFSAGKEEDPEPPPSPMSNRLSRQFAKVNQSLGDLTRGEVGLGDVALLSLIGFGLFQILRKKILPDGVTLLWYATSLHLLSQQLTPKRNRAVSTENQAKAP
jgi:Heavy metal associated domain 2